MSMIIVLYGPKAGASLCIPKLWRPYSWRGLMSSVTPISLHGELQTATGSNSGSDSGTDQRCFFREYCKDLKLSPNNTQFLLDFNQFIDRNTPDACESCIFLTWHVCIGRNVNFLHGLCSHGWNNTADAHSVTRVPRTVRRVLMREVMTVDVLELCLHAWCVLLLVMVEFSILISPWPASEGHTMTFAIWCYSLNRVTSSTGTDWVS